MKPISSYFVVAMLLGAADSYARDCDDYSDSSTQESFNEALLEKDLRCMKEFWEEGASDGEVRLNTCIEDGDQRVSPIGFATIHNALTIQKWLLGKGAKIAQACWEGKNAAHFVETTSAMGILIREGKPKDLALALSSRDDTGNPPLFSALARGKVEVAQLIWRTLKSTEQRNASGDAPAHFVVIELARHVRRDDREERSISQALLSGLTMLLDDGADLEAKNNEDLTVLGAWVSGLSRKVLQTRLQDDSEVARLYLDLFDLLKRKGSRLDARGGRPEYKMFDMAMTSLTELDRFHSPNQIRRIAGIFLDLIEGNGSEATARSQGAPILHHLLFRFGRILLQEDMEKIAEALLDRGSDPNAIPSGDGTTWGRTTALHIASNACLAKVSALLLARGARVNDVDKDGKSALHYAAQNGCEELSGLLVDRGASLHAKDGAGETAFHVALKNRHLKSLAELLLKRGASVDLPDALGNTPLILSASQCWLPLMDRLIASQASIASRNQVGRTALMMLVASCKNAPRILVKKLIQGSDVNTGDANGYTPLMYAARANNLLGVALLMDAGARTNEISNDGRTALSLATDPGVQEWLRYGRGR